MSNPLFHNVEMLLKPYSNNSPELVAEFVGKYVLGDITLDQTKSA